MSKFSKSHAFADIFVTIHLRLFERASSPLSFLASGSNADKAFSFGSNAIETNGHPLEYKGAAVSCEIAI